MSAGLCTGPEYRAPSPPTTGGPLLLGGDKASEGEKQPSRTVHEQVVAALEIARDYETYHEEGGEKDLETDQDYGMYQEAGADPDSKSSNKMEGCLVNSQSLRTTSKFIYREDEISMGNLLGGGNFADTFLATLPAENELKIALKIPKANQSQADDYMKEMKGFLDIPKQRNVLALVGICNIRGLDCFLLEYCDMGSLDKLHDKLKLKEVDNFFQAAEGLFLGLFHLHLSGFVHRDIACRNILVKNDEKRGWFVKVGDFGLCRKTPENGTYYKQEENRLPWAWMSPTALKKQKFTDKSDVWAAGVACWEMLTGGSSPYSEVSMTMMGKHVGIITGTLKLSIPGNVPKSAQEITKACLRFEDEKRPTALQVLQQFIPRGVESIRKHGTNEMKSTAQTKGTAQRSNKEKQEDTSSKPEEKDIIRMGEAHHFGVIVKRYQNIEAGMTVRISTGKIFGLGPYVTALRLEKDGKTRSDKSNEHVVTLAKDEHITSFFGQTGLWTDNLGFYTSKNRKFGPYGGMGGGNLFDTAEGFRRESCRVKALHANMSSGMMTGFHRVLFNISLKFTGEKLI